MSSNLTVFQYVSVQADRTPKRRLSEEQMRAQDEQDAKRGEQLYASLALKIKAIVTHLAAFSGCDFRVNFTSPSAAKSSGKGFVQEEGVIVLGFSVLNKPIIEVAQAIAHEWGHLALGHIPNSYWLKAVSVSEEEAEQEADFYSGVFLGEAGFNLDEIVHIKLSASPHQDGHTEKSLLKRVYYLACGHHHGVDRREMGVGGISGAHVFGRVDLGKALPADADSKFLN